MSIALDGSTPAAVDNTGSTSGTAVTASFSPPAGSLVVIAVNIAFKNSTSTGPSVSVKDSGSTSYTAGPSAYDTHFCGSYLFSHYYSSAPGSITVTATRTGQLGQALFELVTWVLTGAASSQSGAGSNSTTSGGATSYTGSITTTAAGSWAMAAIAAGNSATLTASGLTSDHTETDSTDVVAAGAGHAVTGTPGAETIGFTGNISTDYSWAALEILPASGNSNVSGADTFHGSEGTPAVRISGADTFHGSEAGGILKSSADSFHGAEAAYGLGGDWGHFAESASVNGGGTAVSGADTVHGRDTAYDFGGDWWHGTESGSVNSGSGAKSSADTAHGTEGSSVHAAVTGADSGHATEASSVHAALAGADSFHGTEGSSVHAALAGADSFHGAEGSSVHAAVAVADTWHGADAGSAGPSGPSSADSMKSVESAFYGHLNADTWHGTEGLTVRSAGADRVSGADRPGWSWPSSRDACSGTDKPLGSHPSAADAWHGAEAVRPFPAAGADTVHASDVVHEIGIWTYLETGIRLLAPEPYRHDAAAERRLEEAVNRMAAGVSWAWMSRGLMSRVVRSADGTVSAEDAGSREG